MKPIEVRVPERDIDLFFDLLGPEREEQLQEAAATARELLAGRTVWNVNSTSAGGGVAEMLQPLLAYGRGIGVDARWLVVDGDSEFFRITKRLHNGFHGSAGDGSPLGQDEHRHYEAVLAVNAEDLLARVRPGDFLLLHDPQTAGLVPALLDSGATLIWRSHIGSDLQNDHVEEAWAFLRPYLRGADAYVFTRAAYAPPWLADRLVVIPPSIDPFSTKNTELATDVVVAILGRIGVLDCDGGPVTFARSDGSDLRVERPAVVVSEGPRPGPDVPLVAQVSRWDRLKDMQGVLEGFARHVAPSTDAHLVLVGPDVSGVTDDPEGSQVLEECTAAWSALREEVRRRIALVCLPMHDLEENAAMVNAVQRHSAVVVQKSLAEGFGLTVSEAMWKWRPVVASAVGGINDQIVDGESGLLLDEPSDLEAFGAAVNRLLADEALRARLGEQARARVLEHFIGSRHLLQYGDLLARTARPVD